MAKSKLKTNLAILRQELGQLGKSAPFTKLIGKSESWLRKASCGQIPIHPTTAFIISAKTGYCAAWIEGIAEQKKINPYLENEPYLAKKIADELVENYRNEIYKKFNL
mgnify:CR=1 FL=1|jgi:hypothetical protein